MTPAGQMNRRVQIMRQGGFSGAPSEDAYGQPVTPDAGGWTEVRRPWAKIEPQVAGKTTQSFDAGNYTARVQTLITFRYSKNDRITTGDQVVYTEPGSGLVHTYQINDIVNTAQKNEDLVLICQELDGEG